jgi:hypothetical protein
MEKPQSSSLQPNILAEPSWAKREQLHIMIATDNRYVLNSDLRDVMGNQQVRSISGIDLIPD